VLWRAEGLLEFHPHIKGAFVFAAIDDLAEYEGVIDLEFESGADGDGTLEFESNTALGDILDARGEPDIGFTEKGDPNRLIGLEARFAPLVHTQHIG
jgi:hypothetical protein